MRSCQGSKATERQSDSDCSETKVMASGDWSFVTFVGACGSALYFQEMEDTDLEPDTFRKSPTQPSMHWIKNKDNDFLVVDNEDQLLFEHMNKQQQSTSGCKFIIQNYKSQTSQTSNNGKAVIFCVTKDNQQKVLCCSEQGEICTETLDHLPEEINTSANKALFYLKKVHGPSNTYRVESSLRSSHFLGFEADTQDPSLKKLILRLKKDETDEHYHILLPNIKS